MKKFILALITLILGTHAQAQISGSLLPSDISWDQVNLILAVQQVKGYQNGYQYVTSARKMSDSTVITSDTAQSQGTGTKRSTIEKLSADTWYQTYWIFWDSLRVDSIKGPLIKTAPIPEKVIVTTREIPRLSVSGIMVVVPPRPYPVIVSGVYTKNPNEPYHEYMTPIYFPEDNNTDSAQLFLSTPEYRDYPYCLFIDYPDNVPYVDTVFMCDTLQLKVSPLTPAPLLELVYQTNDCGRITAGIRIIPEVMDTASMIILMGTDGVNFSDTVAVFSGLDNLITLEIDTVGLNPSTTYWFKVISESKDGQVGEFTFSNTTPSATGKPTINCTVNVQMMSVTFNYSGSMRCAGGVVTLSINDTVITIPVGAKQYSGEYSLMLPPGSYDYEICARTAVGDECVTKSVTVIATAVFDLEINRNDIPPDATVIIYDTMGRLIRDCKWLDVVNKTDNPFGLSGVYIVLLLNQDYVEKRVWVK